MAKYSKLLAAGLGLIVMALAQFGVIDLTAQQDAIYNGLVMAATIFGVWAVPTTAGQV